MTTNSRNQTAIYVGGLLLTGFIIAAGALSSGHLQPSSDIRTVTTQQ